MYKIAARYPLTVVIFIFIQEKPKTKWHFCLCGPNSGVAPKK